MIIEVSETDLECIGIALRSTKVLFGILDVFSRDKFGREKTALVDSILSQRFECLAERVEAQLGIVGVSGELYRLEKLRLQKKRIFEER